MVEEALEGQEVVLGEEEEEGGLLLREANTGWLCLVCHHLEAGRT